MKNTPMTQKEIIQKKVIREMKSHLSFTLSTIVDLKREESLSNEGFSKLELIKNMTLSNLKLTGLIENVIFGETSPSAKIIINIFDFLNEIVSSINNFIAGYNGIEVILSNKLRKKRNIYINPTELEYTLYSLIAFLMNNFTEDGKKRVKINVSEADDIKKTFSITLSGEGIPLPSIYGQLLGNLEFVNEFSDIDQMNICVINMNVKLLNGNIMYRRTKTNNKFHITLPANIPTDTEINTNIDGTIKEFGFSADTSLISAFLNNFSEKL